MTEGCLILPLNEIPFIWCKSHKVSPSYANYTESYCGFLSSSISTSYKNILSYEEHDLQRQRITRKFCLKIYYLQDAKIL